MRTETVIAALLAMFPFLSAHAVSLAGVVQAEDETPVAGATVWALQEGGVFSAETDAEGRFRLEGLEAAETSLTAYRPGLALGGYTDFLLGDTEVTVLLPPAESLHLRAVSGPGLPVPGARVRRITVGTQFTVLPDRLAPHGFPKLRSDDGGAIDLDFLPKGVPSALWITHYRYADAEVVCIPGSEDFREAVMLPGVELRGRITGEEKPLEGAYVTVWQDREEEGRRVCAETETGPDGQYAVQAGRGDYFVSMRHPEYASPPPIEVFLGRYGEPTVLDFKLPRPRRLSGTVLLPDDTPCAGMPLTYQVGDLILDATRTDLEGRFRFRVASPDGVIVLSPPLGFMTKEAPEIPVALGSVETIELKPIRLEELPTVTGVVLGKDKTPEANVLLTSLNEDLPFWTFTDDQGAFRIQLAAIPEDGKGRFRAEHAQRFLRADFEVKYRKLSPVEVVLQPYTPDQEQLKESVGLNKLSDMANKVAPAIQCRAWWNTEPLTPDLLRGKVAVLTFWTGFDRSKQGITRMDELSALYHLLREDKEVFFLAVHDGGSEEEFVKTCVEEHGIEFPVGIDTENLDTFSAYRINTIPQTMLIDGTGVLRYFHVEGRLLELIKVLKRKG